MNARTLALLAGMTIWAAASHAETPVGATDFTKADTDKMLALGPVDHQAKVVDVGPLNIAISVVIRTALNKAPDAPVEGLVDTQVSKVYTIIAGSGTLVTGGRLLNGKAIPEDKTAAAPTGGAALSGVSEGGVVRVVGVGDMVIVPAGVFAGWKQVPDGVTYLVTRVDPERRLPAGYVNAALK